MVCRVVLVDDNRNFLAALQDYIEVIAGMKVVGTASTSDDALTVLLRANPELLIVDLSMPGMNGLELTRLIRQQRPDLRIIMLTLLDTALHHQAALQAGADAFVTKATMQDDLITAIKSLGLNPN